MVHSCCVHHICLRRQSCTTRSPTLRTTRPIIQQPVSIKPPVRASNTRKSNNHTPWSISSPLPPLQQVPTTPLLFILLTKPAWLSSSDPPTSKNLPCRPPSVLHHLPTPLTLNRPANLPPLRRGTRRTRPEIGWDPLPSIPTRGSLSTALWVRLMVFMPLSMTAGEYGGLR